MGRGNLSWSRRGVLCGVRVWLCVRARARVSSVVRACVCGEGQRRAARLNAEHGDTGFTGVFLRTYVLITVCFDLRG